MLRKTILSITGLATVGILFFSAGALSSGQTMAPAPVISAGSATQGTQVSRLTQVTPVVKMKPGASNTGVPQDIILKDSGPVTATQDGQIIEGLNINGCIVIAANNVVIRNSRITCTNSTKNRAVIYDRSGRTGLVIEDTEIDGGGITEIGVDASNTTLRRVNIHHFTDGVRLSVNTRVEDSWIHEMTRVGTLHPDAIQGISAKNILIVNNTLDPRNFVSGDLGNAAIQLGSETGTMTSTDVVIDGNYMDGGNVSLNISGAITAENFQIANNRFGTNSRYGPILIPRRVPLGTGNVMEVSGEPIRVQYTK